MKKLPTKRGEVDAAKLSIEENHARLKPLLQTLTASLQSQSTYAAERVAWEISQAAMAIYNNLILKIQADRESETALTMTRKDTA